jgi:phosphoribosyl-ATP pyrophosphohydrolase/phosphoribosyl-ATP pyrophosphohydrolase/phosphoribosyl-AMP cyclohydrolase
MDGFMQIFDDLAALIAERKAEPKEGSYTCKLLKGGDNMLVKKLGEENAEYIRAFLTGTDEELAGEAADYIYHLMVSLEYRGVGMASVAKVLQERYK